MRWLAHAAAAVLLVCALAGCEDSETAVSDGAVDAGVADQGAQGKDTGGTPDRAALEVGAGDVSTPDTKPAADASPTATSYMFWQSPGGFARTGPAVEVYGDGTIRLWKSSKEQAATVTSGWDKEIKTSPTLVNGLFALLAKVNFSKLPHAVSPKAECWPSLYWISCPTCKPVILQHNKVSGIKPELDPVLNWFKTNLSGKWEGSLPHQYCFGA